MNNNLVSILIPYYNHALYIDQTLRSIRSDGYSSIETIIIDDGSCDNERVTLYEIVKRFDDLNIKILTRENRGLSTTLNELIVRANGKYLLFCASDDYLINQTIKKRIDILSASKKRILISDVEILKNGEFLKKDKNTKRILSNINTSKKIIDFIVRDWSLAGSISLIEKSVFEDIGLFDEKMIVEDWDFYLRAAISEEIIMTDLVCSVYRLHDTNTHASSVKRKRIFYDLSKTAFRYLSKFGYLNKAYLILSGIKMYVKSI
jgi:glycosyltransferase involved in cell wall biosynthesis